jgi:hypothetical protein
MSHDYLNTVSRLVTAPSTGDPSLANSPLISRIIKEPLQAMISMPSDPNKLVEL